jgi:hypothetical protein
MSAYNQADDSGLGRDALALHPVASAPNRSSNNNRRLSSPSPPPPPAQQQQQQSHSSAQRNDRRRPTLDDRRQPSIRLRRLGSASTLASQNTTATTDFAQNPAPDPSGRRRSSSEPQRPPWATTATNNSNSLSVPRGTARPTSTHMPRLEEEAGRPSTTLPPDVDIEQLAAAGNAANLVETARPGLWKRASVAALQPFRRQQQLGDDDLELSPQRRPRRGTWGNEYDADLVDILDVVGSFSLNPSLKPSTRLTHDFLQIPRWPRSQPLPTSKTPCSFPIWARS